MLGDGAGPGSGSSGNSARRACLGLGPRAMVSAGPRGRAAWVLAGGALAAALALGAPSGPQVKQVRPDADRLHPRLFALPEGREGRAGCE